MPLGGCNLKSTTLMYSFPKGTVCNTEIAMQLTAGVLLNKF
jgi:hypothetical protein